MTNNCSYNILQQSTEQKKLRSGFAFLCDQLQSGSSTCGALSFHFHAVAFTTPTGKILLMQFHLSEDRTSAPHKEVHSMPRCCRSSTMTVSTTMKHSPSRDMGIIKDFLLSNNGLRKKSVQPPMRNSKKEWYINLFTTVNRQH